jgi:hypothetical protein
VLVLAGGGGRDGKVFDRSERDPKTSSLVHTNIERKAYIYCHRAGTTNSKQNPQQMINNKWEYFLYHLITIITNHHHQQQKEQHHHPKVANAYADDMGVDLLAMVRDHQQQIPPPLPAVSSSGSSSDVSGAALNVGNKSYKQDEPGLYRMTTSRSRSDLLTTQVLATI